MDKLVEGSLGRDRDWCKEDQCLARPFYLLPSAFLSLSHGERLAVGFLCCPLWSCLALHPNCWKSKLMMSPAAAGGGPGPLSWHPAPVIFL